jgi:hypothetical protein
MCHMDDRQIRRKLLEFSKGKLISRVQFNVNPRYIYYGTPSDIETALRCVASERDEYEAASEGLFGEELQERARDLGFGGGIVEILYETRKGWAVLDLVTGESCLRPFRQTPLDAELSTGVPKMVAPERMGMADALMKRASDDHRFVMARRSAISRILREQFAARALVRGAEGISEGEADDVAEQILKAIEG